MSAYTDALATVRTARAARDQARDELYALQLRRLQLERALRRESRGHGSVDDAVAERLDTVRGQADALDARLAAIAARQAELAELEQLDRTAGLTAALDEAESRSAALATQAAQLADQLDPGVPADQRGDVVARVREVQSERAALAHTADGLRVDLSSAQDQVRSCRAEAAALAEEAKAAWTDAARAREQQAALEAQAAQPDLHSAARGNDDQLAAKRREVTGLEDAVRAAVAGVYGDSSPQQLVEEWDDDLPILLLPLRVETRWKSSPAAGDELCVRVYPDDIEVATHEKVLTAAEVTSGHDYWTAHRSATTDAERATAWAVLSQRFGGNRAAWTARETKPQNWDAASVDSTLTLDFPPVPLTKPDSWSDAPHSRVLPDRFVLLGWRGGTLVINELGRPLDDVVVLGPAPLEDSGGDPSISRDPVDQTLTLGDSFRWVRDFDEAVTHGMGFRLPVDAVTARDGLDELVVLGLKGSADDADAQALLGDLIDNHHYARPGFALVQQGTATNNTGGSDSGYSRAGRSADESAIEVGPPLFAPVQDRALATDGQRLADLLGLAYDPLLHATGADLTDNVDAVAANRALYAGTLGYYLDHMLDGVVDEDVLWTLRRHFTDTVTGRGPVSAIRVGSQPYGILPTSAFGRWRTPSGRLGEAGIVIGHPDRFEAGLYHVLARFDQAWSSVLPSLVRIGAPGDGAAHLLDVLGLHPTSEEFYQRVGYSYDTLRNVEAFMTSSTELADVMKMIIEGMASRTLLADLGYDVRTADGTLKPLPLLLQLIWRHAHQLLDPTQLIDGQPFSETAPVKPYDAVAGKNFIDWLLANGADADKLEAQDFGGAPRPSSLLYMLLHFSLAMESARGVHTWLGTQAIEADVLIRSAKFLNVGASPTPSTWEVFRAPASSIVAGVTSDLPLLELLHSPQLSLDSGRGVAEQRAALDWLRGASTARLERVLVEHVDTLGYRLDAWQTSLFTRRLHRQRNLDAAPADRRTGVYLGAYGYLENVRPNRDGRMAVVADTLPLELRAGSGALDEQVGNGGYVHASSLNHATAAALLRNGYLTHATPADPDSLAVNLSSDRVRRARYLLDGFRGGQSLEALLGAQFERGLHDWTTRTGAPVILDQLKPLFRAAFPIKVTRVPQAADAEAGTGAATVTEDHQVVNGVDLANAQAFPWGIVELAALSNDQKAALQQEKDSVKDTMDALRDLLTAEAAYQLALGNFDRAAAVVQSVGRGTVPPDIEIVNTPRGTDVSFTNRLAVQLSTAAQPDPWPAVGALTQRARLEPALNAWLGALLPDPAQVRCSVQATAADGSVVAHGTVSLAALGLQPIDVVYLTRSQPQQSSEAELESRVRLAFARAHGVPDDAVVRITFGDSGAAGVASFAEVLPLVDRLRRLLGSCRPLNARHFQSASADAPQPAGNPGRVDVPELLARVGARLDAIRKLFRNGAALPPTPPLEQVLAASRVPGAPPATVEALRTALLAIADAGFVYGFPVTAVGTSTRELGLLASQADSVLARHDALAPATDAVLADVTAGSYPADRKAELLVDLVKGWVGGDFLLVPHFTFIHPPAVATAHAARAHLLDHARGIGIALPVTEWLHGAACVRPLVHGFEIVRAMAEAGLPTPLSMSPLQLPHRTGDSWLGVEFPTGLEVVHDTVAVVQHLPQGFDPTLAQCGLLVDEWGETIPNRHEVTGLSFNYDAPNSEPPQALLLAVTPHETGSWSWDDLVETVRDTFRRARLRAVEPDQLGGLAGIGTLLPAVMAEFSTGRGSISLDYSLVWAPIREAALNISATKLAAGTGS